MSNYVTKKELEHATSTDTSDSAAKKDFIALKAEVDKLDNAWLVNVLTSLNNLETKVNYWDVGKLKTSHRLEKIKQCSGKTSPEKLKFQHTKNKSK